MIDVKGKRPWKQQRILKRQDIPSQQEILNLADEFDTDRDKALFILAYLTAGRITEIVKCSYFLRPIYKKVEVVDKDGYIQKKAMLKEDNKPVVERINKVLHNYPGIRRKDIYQEERKGKNILMINIENRKNKKILRKRLPIPIHQELELIGRVLRYVKSLPEPDTPLFNFGRCMAERIIARVNMNPHFLRDIRLTHMVTIYGFNGFQLQKFAGWKDSQPAERYIRLGVDDLISNY